jgi:4-hydroxybenzoate polyprenyltransferase
LGRDILAASKYGIHRLRTRLGTRGLVILGAAVIVAGLALNWSWLVAIGVAPLLLTALPCAVMCALGVCMMPKGGKSPENQAAPDDAHPENTALPAKRRADE